jgi:hypothetical protein
MLLSNFSETFQEMILGSLLWELKIFREKVDSIPTTMDSSDDLWYDLYNDHNDEGRFNILASWAGKEKNQKLGMYRFLNIFKLFVSDDYRLRVVETLVKNNKLHEDCGSEDVKEYFSTDSPYDSAVKTILKIK